MNNNNTVNPMFSTTSINFLTASLNTTFDELSEKFSSENLSVEKEDHFHKGNFLVKTLPLRSSYQNLITRSRIISDRNKLQDNGRRPECLHYEKLQRDVTQEIFTLNEVGDFKTCINTINDVREGLGKDFFGALLIDQGQKDEIINPLHPLVSIILSEENDYTIGSKIYSIVIFAYKNRESMDSYYMTNEADHDLIEENLSDLISCYFNKQAEATKITSRSVDPTNETIRIQYKIKKSEEEIQDEEHYMVAHQIFTEGIVSPYYGTSFLKIKNGNNTGIALSPMMSCNIAADTGFNNGRSFDSKYQQETNSEIRVEYNSVCTGSYTNTTVAGMRTLTHSNASSPHNRYVIQQGSLAYADACIDKALAMYKLTGIIQEEVKEEVEEEVELTEEEAEKQRKKAEKKKKKEEKRSRRGTPGAHEMAAEPSIDL